MKFNTFIYRMFFTRDDQLDSLQVLFVAVVLVTLAVAWKLLVTFPDMSDVVRIESLITLRWLAGLLVATAVPTWMVEPMVKILTRGKFPSTPPTNTTEEQYDIPVEHTS